MNGQIAKILIVDDETYNLDLLEMDLTREGFEVIRSENGQEALEKLQQISDIDIILLDRMMPVMDGMQFIREIKGNVQFRDIPVIMQTAAGQSQQVREGLAAGVYHYLIKPFEPELMISIVRSALNETLVRKEARKYANLQMGMRGVMKQGSFQFRTLQEMKNLAYYIASCCPKPDVVAYGLNELMTNAIEHGNLNITYQEKLELVNSNTWQSEVERRLELEENKNKHAMLTFDDDGTCITISIKDQGKGFNWSHYMEFDPLRMMSDPHGRGIAITRVTSIPDIEFKGNGSEVVCRIRRA